MSALAAIALLAGVAGCSASERVEVDLPAQVEGAFPADTQQQLQTAVTDALAATGSTGAIVGVWAPWSGEWIAGVGTEGPGGAAVSADRIVPAGRTTRAMTCDVMYALVAAGKIATTDSVTQWVSSVPELADVTIGDLCRGTSGLASYAPRLYGLWIGNPTRTWDPRELVSYGMGDTTGTLPSTGFTDSDTAYLLLGLALERAGGDDLGALFATYITGPLGLSTTSLSTGEVDTASAFGGFLTVAGSDGVMNCAEPRTLTAMSPSIGWASAGARSSITDLGRYTQALATRSLPATPENRFENPLAMSEDDPAWLSTAGGAVLAGSLVGQFGSVPGYLTASFADPATGLTVAVVLNNSAASADTAAYLAWELAALASKAPAAAGQTTPEAGLPWTAQQFHDAIAASPVCPG